MASTLKYPKTEKKVVVDEYHGIKVEDPYRWLEDPDSEATQAWVKEQVGLTDGYFEKECKIRAEITARQMEMQNYEKFGIPFKRGKHYFFFRNDGLQNHYVLYKQSSLDGEASALLDPNKFSKDGTASLGVTKFSDNAELVAYGVKRSGSDWTTIKVRRVSDCEDFKVKFSSVSWIGDEGFFYSRYPTPKAFAGKDDSNFKRGEETEALANQTLYYHKVGTDQSEDPQVFQVPEQPKWMVTGQVTHDGNTLLISMSESCDPVNRLYIAPLSKWDRKGPLKNVVKVIDNFDALYEYIHNVGDEYWFRTNKEAPCYKIVKFDINKSESKDWVTVVPEKELVVLEDATVANGSFLVTQHLEHVKNKITLLDLDVASLSISAHHKQTEIFYKFTSFLYPGTVMHYDIESGKTTKFKETIVKGFKPEDYVATQAFFESKDKTKVPMFIVHKKAIDPKNPKGFNISLTPSFSISRLVWMQHFNGIYAVPNLRGGGEYGEEWHKAGTKLKKQNVFDDFQFAAKYLIDNNYTSPKNLAIWGGSNGGLLTAACANQAPELFGCAVAAVGVLDMLRFHKFTIGYAWCSDYGNADKDKDEFEALRAISPCHNVQEGVQYPAVLVTTADHDDRVSPLHSYKFISALQDKAGKDNKQPLLIRIEVKAGHGGGKPLSKQIEEISDVYAFMARNIGAKWQK